MSRSSWPTLLKTTHLYMADTLASWITSLLTVYPEQRHKGPLYTRTLLLFKEATVLTSNGETEVCAGNDQSLETVWNNEARSLAVERQHPRKAKKHCRQLAGKCP